MKTLVEAKQEIQKLRAELIELKFLRYEDRLTINIGTIAIVAVAVVVTLSKILS